MFARIGFIVLATIALAGAGCDGSDGGTGSAGPQGEPGLAGETGAAGENGLDGAPGTSGKSVLMNYDFAHLDGEARDAGSYALLQSIDDDLSGTLLWEDLTRQASLGPEPLGVVTALLINDLDTNGIDHGDYLGQNQAGHIVTVWLSQRKWVDYRITSMEALNDGRHKFGLAYTASDEADGVEDLSPNADSVIQIQWSASQRGEQGTQGPIGLAGPAGADGADGAPGADGADGADGGIGGIGPQGDPGLDGEDGAPGIDGIDGAPGLDGLAGDPGADGEDGDDGADGTDGTNHDPSVIDEIYASVTIEIQAAIDDFYLLLAPGVEDLVDTVAELENDSHRISIEPTEGFTYIHDIRIWADTDLLQIKAIIGDINPGTHGPGNGFTIHMGLRNHIVTALGAIDNGAWAMKVELFGVTPATNTTSFQTGAVQIGHLVTLNNGSGVSAALADTEVTINYFSPTWREEILIRIPIPWLQDELGAIYELPSLNEYTRVAVQGFYAKEVGAPPSVRFPRRSGNVPAPRDDFTLYDTIHITQAPAP